jgi:hypothetical protein
MDTKSDIEIIKNELDELKNSVAKITISVDKITIAVDKLTIVCSRMDDHINFVENTYDSIKTPLNYAKTTIEKIMGCDGKLLK